MGNPRRIPDELQTKTTTNSQVVLVVLFLQEDKRIQFILLKLVLALTIRLREQNGTRQQFTIEIPIRKVIQTCEPKESYTQLYPSLPDFFLSTLLLLKRCQQFPILFISGNQVVELEFLNCKIKGQCFQEGCKLTAFLSYQ